MKTVLVTGGAKGIGNAIAQRFQKNGYIVYVNYLNTVPPNAFNIIRADVSNKRDVEKMIEKIGHIDILINNAGICLEKPITDVTENEYDHVFSVNMKGVFNCVQATLPSMISRKNGCIINISSMWGSTGASCEVVYSASKSAVEGFTKALAKEVGLSGIRVNAISPGLIDTDMNNNLDKNDIEVLVSETPLNRIGKPKDIADIAFFLASDEADFITGQIISVNGGFLI